MSNQKTYSSNEVAKVAGVHPRTLLRWLELGKIPEPRRDRNGWRAFTDDELNAIVAYATELHPPTPRPALVARQLATHGEERAPAHIARAGGRQNRARL